ncbi:hypothetical protein AAW14_06060 [Streptomyces hygroscopicus]|uniref:hypothetical protein n=1 Tax=Streptomyces hygroscopicus TaxID=1912 RepID=UPI0022404C04|nr:hypothetical protein [Streptomyces hygroscopicus]MCW7941610.1 hypothetical protein [Streptomyces hygroscopicus]
MATALEPLHAEDVEAVLIRLDADYRTIYGPDLSAWSRGVRGEYFETLRSRRTMDHEANPLHPRRASAARRRRHRRQLGYRIHRIAPGAITVLLTPVWTDVHGPMERVFVVTARNADGHQLKLPRGGSRQIASLMQGAYPNANWDRTHTWRADSNQLTGWRAS